MSAEVPGGAGEAPPGHVCRNFARARQHAEGIAHTRVLDERAVSEPRSSALVIDDEGVVALAEITGRLSLMSEPRPWYIVSGEKWVAF